MEGNFAFAAQQTFSRICDAQEKHQESTSGVSLAGHVGAAVSLSTPAPSLSLTLSRTCQ